MSIKALCRLSNCCVPLDSQRVPVVKKFISKVKCFVFTNISCSDKLVIANSMTAEFDSIWITFDIFWGPDLSLNVQKMYLIASDYDFYSLFYLFMLLKGFWLVFWCVILIRAQEWLVFQGISFAYGWHTYKHDDIWFLSYVCTFSFFMSYYVVPIFIEVSCI